MIKLSLNLIRRYIHKHSTNLCSSDVIANFDTTPAFCWGIAPAWAELDIGPSVRLRFVSGCRVTALPSRNENCSRVSKQAFANSSRSLRLDSTSARAGRDIEERETTAAGGHELELLSWLIGVEIGLAIWPDASTVKLGDCADPGATARASPVVCTVQ